MKHLKTFETFNANESIKISKEELKTCYVYSWYEERGELQVSVRNAETEEDVYHFNSNTLEDENRQEYLDNGFDLVNDGFMENMEDYEGLEEYLISNKLIPSGSTVLTQEHFENANIVDEI